jgi:hypothetical protein
MGPEIRLNSHGLNPHRPIARTGATVGAGAVDERVDVRRGGRVGTLAAASAHTRNRRDDRMRQRGQSRRRSINQSDWPGDVTARAAPPRTPRGARYRAAPANKLKSRWGRSPGRGDGRQAFCHRFLGDRSLYLPGTVKTAQGALATTRPATLPTESLEKPLLP